MPEVLSGLKRFGWRPATLAYVAALFIGWLTYSGTAYAMTGVWGSGSGYVDALVFQLLLAFVQAGVVRYYGKEAIDLAPPRVAAWMALTTVLATAAYGLALLTQILAYLVAKAFVENVRSHEALEGALALAVLFPLMVWQVALLVGERRIGLKRACKGVWRDRPAVPAMAFFALAALGIPQFQLEARVPVDAGEVELLLWTVPMLLPVCAGYVFLNLLALVTFLAIEREVAMETATFD